MSQIVQAGKPVLEQLMLSTGPIIATAEGLRHARDLLFLTALSVDYEHEATFATQADREGFLATPRSLRPFRYLYLALLSDDPPNGPWADTAYQHISYQHVAYRKPHHRQFVYKAVFWTVGRLGVYVEFDGPMTTMMRPWFGRAEVRVHPDPIRTLFRIAPTRIPHSVFRRLCERPRASGAATIRPPASTQLCRCV